MKKGNIINLIKYYSEKNDIAFRKESYIIANEFDKIGDHDLADYIMTLMSDANVFIPMEVEESFEFLKRVKIKPESFPLPSEIQKDIFGIVNSTKHKIGVNKFLFYGSPGTGKTESAKTLAKLLDRDLFIVDFSHIIDSKLGQTIKNIASLFEEISNFPHPEKLVVLFDELDAIALTRMDSQDLREMGRAVSMVLKGLDELNEKIVLIATTNLYKFLDKALLRRFDFSVNFDRYTKDDLIKVAESILESYLAKCDNVARNIKLFRKLFASLETIPNPGDLKNIIKTSLAFSNIDDKYDYFKRLYSALNNKNIDLSALKKEGFSLREIEILTDISKSQVSRELKVLNE
ncbi:ATP-binding protein [Mesomycoplasma hyorhinis]|uniref:ATP-binding protein n=1 Tax=Mesomycoplasma hyorhinis TaxID=2100 RepID=UPI001C05B9E9|nr:ATP-binding protein [Mesomycoplasma hyorhinis]